MHNMLLKYKQAILEQQILNPKRFFPDQRTKIPRLFPTLIQIFKNHRRRARIARISRMKKHGKSRWV